MKRSTARQQNRRLEWSSVDACCNGGVVRGRLSRKYCDLQVCMSGRMS